MAPQPTYPAAFNIIKLCEIMLCSRTGVMSADQIAASLEVSGKTARRYLDILFANNPSDLFSVRSGADLGRTGHERRKKFLVLHRVGLEQRTGFQLAPLYLSHFFLSFLEGTSLDESMHEALQEFHDSIKDTAEQAIAGSLGRKFHVVAAGVKSYKNHQRTVDKMLSAVVLQYPVVISYRKPGGKQTREYTFNPLTMLIYKQGLYVIGSSAEWSKPRFFAIERIAKCTVQRGAEHRFTYPSHYDPRDFCSGSFGIFQEDRESDVRIRFSAGVADYIRARRWHPSQRIEEGERGGVVLTMRIAGLQELTTWVLGFGPEAEVLEPADFRNLCAGQLADALKQYA